MYDARMLNTFLPAYLPRVIMATRPTLRTSMARVSSHILHSQITNCDLHFIVTLRLAKLITLLTPTLMEPVCAVSLTRDRFQLVDVADSAYLSRKRASIWFVYF